MLLHMYTNHSFWPQAVDSADIIISDELVALRFAYSSIIKLSSFLIRENIEVEYDWVGTLALLAQNGLSLSLEKSENKISKITIIDLARLVAAGFVAHGQPVSVIARFLLLGHRTAVGHRNLVARPAALGKH